MYKDNNMFLTAGTLVIIVLVIMCLVGSCVYTEGNQREITIKVTDKGIKNYKNRSTYLIYGKDEDNKIVTYRIEDSLVQGKFNSSDIYGSIEIGKTYKFVIVGERNKFLSMYPNIVKVIE